MITGAYLGNVLIQFTEKDLTIIHNTRISDIERVDPKMEHINCPLCSHKKVEQLVEAEGQGKLGQCLACGVVYAYERPTLGVSNALYRHYVPSNLTDPEIRRSQLETRPKELNEDLDIIEQYVERDNLLDVGASSGDFLVYARVRGWKVEATELSELCADFMARTLNIPVNIGNILDIEFEKEKYKAIALRHCIEHLRSPIEELKVLYNALDNNGILFITTPEHAKDLELIKENHMMPLHLVNYTEQTLGKLLSKVGFTMISYESLDTEGDIKNMRVVAIKDGVNSEW